MQECVDEFRAALKNGCKRIILVGDNTGAYGVDIGLTFPDLLREIIETKGNYEIHIDYLNPQWVIRYAHQTGSYF